MALKVEGYQPWKSQRSGLYDGNGWEVIPSLVGGTCEEGWRRCNRAAANRQVGRGETRLATSEAVAVEMV
jgi:hypothetical protein